MLVYIPLRIISPVYQRERQPWRVPPQSHPLHELHPLPTDYKILKFKFRFKFKYYKYKCKFPPAASTANCAKYYAKIHIQIQIHNLLQEIQVEIQIQNLLQKYTLKYKYKNKPTCNKVESTPSTKCFFSTSNSSSSNALLNAFASLAWSDEVNDVDMSVRTRKVDDVEVAYRN